MGLTRIAAYAQPPACQAQLCNNTQAAAGLPMPQCHTSAVNEKRPSSEGGSRSGRSGLAATNCAAQGRLAAMQRRKSAASGRRHTRAASAARCSAATARCCCSSHRMDRSKTAGGTCGVLVGVDEGVWDAVG